MVMDKSKLAALCLACFISGCASVKETYNQYGKKSYALNCSGTARGWDKCYSAAGEICGSLGFNIDQKSAEIVSSSESSVYGSSSAQSTARSMVISCKDETK